jgi:hypothetical protein
MLTTEPPHLSDMELTDAHIVDFWRNYIVRTQSASVDRATCMPPTHPKLSSRPSTTSSVSSTSSVAKLPPLRMK